MIQDFAQKLTQALKKSPIAQRRSSLDNSPDVDPDKLKIRCLRRVIRLAVPDFLKSIKSISEGYTAKSEYEPAKMTESAAESIVAEGVDASSIPPAAPPPDPLSIGTIIYKVGFGDNP